MLIRAIVLFLILCTGCKSGIIPCPEVKGLRLKKSHANKRFRHERVLPREEAEPIITVSSEARTPQPASKNSNKYRYVKYTIQHIDVEDLDCPKPGEKRMPRAVKENIRKHRKKVRYYYEDAPADSLSLLPATYPKR